LPRRRKSASGAAFQTDFDGEARGERFSVAQRRQLGEDIDAALTPANAAMWASDQKAKAWGRAEVERARRIGEYATNLGSLAEEVRDIRPD
jgi:hypothetical protein